MLSLPEKAYIYGLRDPRIPDVVWYVGKTNNHHNRLQYHLKDAKANRKPTPVQKWISRLQTEGVKPILSTLTECPFSEWKQTEREFISQYRKKNLLLINKMDGGNGTGVKGKKEFCDDCGTKRIHLYPSDGSLRCPICRKARRSGYMKSWHEKNPTYNSEYLKVYYQAHMDERKTYAKNFAETRKASGVCVYCNQPSRKNRTTCENHAGAMKNWKKYER